MNELSNLDRSGRRARLFGGIGALLVGVTASALMIMEEVALPWRWPLFFLFFMGFLGIIQAAMAT